MYIPGTGPLYTPIMRKHILENFSPAGLHVLVVDDDLLCLNVLERMLKQCEYRVTTCNEVSHALEILRDKEKEFDLIISDVYMPNEDGFKLLEVIGFELDLPVIMISANPDLNVVMKGVLHGACDYLIKPVRIEELRNIWQHVIRRKGKDFRRAEPWEATDPAETQASESQDDFFRKRKECLEIPEVCMEDFSSSPKKARVNWSQQLHQQFVNAVNQLGVDKAVPKRILEIMNVQGLSRENVASHLQKYRLYLKRLSGVIPEPFPVASFQASEDGSPGGSMLIRPGRKEAEPSTNVKGLNLGAGLTSKSGKEINLDSGTMTSLLQFHSSWQKHVANRAQVLTAIGLQGSQYDPSSSQGALVRMASVDLGFLAQSVSSPEGSPSGQASAKVVNDLARFNINSTIKLEENAVTPVPSLGGGLRGQQCHIERPAGHRGTAEEDDKRLVRRVSLPVNVRDSVYFKDFAEAVSQSKRDVMMSRGSQAGSAAVYGLASGLFVTSDVPTTSAWSSSGKPNKHDYNNTSLQTAQESLAMADLSEEAAFDNNNMSKKQSLSGSTATVMSEQTFSDSSFEALIEDLGILPEAQRHSAVQKANSEAVNVDQYLQFD